MYMYVQQLIIIQLHFKFHLIQYKVAHLKKYLFIIIVAILNEEQDYWIYIFL